jgi:hypothetical protein
MIFQVWSALMNAPLCPIVDGVPIRPPCIVLPLSGCANVCSSCSRVSALVWIPVRSDSANFSLRLNGGKQTFLSE